MEIACPSCGKPNTAAPCQRCGCDLAPLFSIERPARHSLGAAAEHLRRGNSAEAGELAARAWDLHRSPDAAGLAFLAGIAMDDFGAALAWHNRLAFSPSSGAESRARA